MPWTLLYKEKWILSYYWYKLENVKNNEYQNYIKIRDDEYLYYTKENKLGKLYKSFNLSDFEENKEDIINIDEIIRKEYNKLSNPFIDFKFYINKV